MHDHPTASAVSLWEIAPGFSVSANTDSKLTGWMNEIFGRMAKPPSEKPDLDTVSLECRTAEDGRASLYVNGRPCFSARDEEHFPSLLEVTLTTLGARRRSGFLVFHASGVDVDGVFVMMTGSKGSGKSTLSAWISQHGGVYFGDELIYIDYADGRPVAFPKAVALKEGSFGLFDVERGYASTTRGDVQYYQPENCTSAFSKGSELGLIVIPQYRPDARLSVTRLSPDELALLLLQQCLGGLEAKQDALDTLTQLSRVPACIIEFSCVSDAGQTILSLCGDGE